MSRWLQELNICWVLKRTQPWHDEPEIEIISILWARCGRVVKIVTRHCGGHGSRPSTPNNTWQWSIKIHTRAWHVYVNATPSFNLLDVQILLLLAMSSQQSRKKVIDVLQSRNLERGIWSYRIIHNNSVLGVTSKTVRYFLKQDKNKSKWYQYK